MMKVFEANITPAVSDVLHKELKGIASYEAANQNMFDICGVKYFFDNQVEFKTLKEIISDSKSVVKEPDRTEYGDFQTNSILSTKIASFLGSNGSNPTVLIEPTCGIGNFIVASLARFHSLDNVYAVEIYKPYVWETKFNILQFFINNPARRKPEIRIFHFNVFDFDFNEIAQQHLNDEILIIGNPPWVTSSTLSSLESDNLPAKSNFKKHSGLDAMTGKGNFDIGEFITLMVFDAFQSVNGNVAFLVKNSVIKNIVFDQRERNYKISGLQKLSIDSKKEFNVSVEASLFFCKLNQAPEHDCVELDFYDNSKPVNKFGWVENKFVSDVERYKESNDIDGICPFEWRQGIKHDLSAVMELERVNGHFVNGLQQEINLEEDLVYGILKSSDLKQIIIDTTRKFTIITQKKVGQDTSFIKKEFPKTFTYLQKNKSQFDLRKSSIYNDKPDFSIFGIGDYSFKPYKIAISGLYKKYCFNLVLPLNGKPIMLDDTCYLLGFDNLDFAVYTLILLNADKTRELLKAITFADAKRTFTKDVLMRIDLLKVSIQFSAAKLKNELDDLNSKHNLDVQPDKWDEYIQAMKPMQALQLNLFA